MKTTIVPWDKDLCTVASPARVELRCMSKATFIEKHASGTLRKNSKLGFDNARQYLDERTAYEFGWGFEARWAKCVTIGKAITEGDCHALSEAGWHAERYMNIMMFPGDEAIVAYITVDVDGERREGVGIVITKTSVEWLPTDYDVIVFALLAECDTKTHMWKECVNPC